MILQLIINKKYMKIIASILIASIITLIWILKFEWHLNFWVINLIWYDNTFNTNLSFIKISTDYIYHIPNIIYDLNKDFIQKILNIDDKETFLLIVFTFFLIFSWFLIYILKYFPKKNDRIYLVLWVISLFFIIVEFMM